MGDAYLDVMVRTITEAQRLDEQFDVMTANIGYLIHPQIASQLPPNPKIADVATGTGHFLECVRNIKEFKNATLHGYDISPDMFPKEPPAGILFDTLDAKKPVPEKLHQAYDLVHVRLLVGAMQPDEWQKVAANLSKLLRPGGWLQWEEFNITSTTYFRNYPESTFETADRLSKMFIKANLERFAQGWNTLHDDMATAGLEPVIRDIVSSDRLADTRQRITAAGMPAIMAWARKMKVMEPEELDKAEKQAYADIKSGGYYRNEIYVFCGKKPEAQSQHRRMRRRSRVIESKVKRRQTAVNK